MSIAKTAYWFFRRWLHDRDRGMCGICGEPVQLTKMDIDHIVQLADGGSDDPVNLRATHALCNRQRPRIHPISTKIELMGSDLLALKAMADAQSFELNAFIIHTLRRMVEDRNRPAAPSPPA